MSTHTTNRCETLEVGAFEVLCCVQRTPPCAAEQLASILASLSIHAAVPLPCKPPPSTAAGAGAWVPLRPPFAAELPASVLASPSLHAAVPLPGKPLELLGFAQCAGTWVPLARGAHPPPFEAPEPQAMTPAKGSRENPHPRPPKVCLY